VFGGEILLEEKKRSPDAEKRERETKARFRKTIVGKNKRSFVKERRAAEGT